MRYQVERTSAQVSLAKESALKAVEELQKAAAEDKAAVAAAQTSAEAAKVELISEKRARKEAEKEVESLK